MAGLARLADFVAEVLSVRRGDVREESERYAASPTLATAAWLQGCLLLLGLRGLSAYHKR